MYIRDLVLISLLVILNSCSGGGSGSGSNANTSSTSPANINLNGRYSDIAIRDQYAYLAAGEEGLIIVDISDPANPLPVKVIDTAFPPAIPLTVEVIGTGFPVNKIFLNGNHAYLPYSSYDFCTGVDYFENNTLRYIEVGFIVVDITNPLNASISTRKYLSSSYYYDGLFMDFRAINNYAYVTIKDPAADLHFRIYDLGDPLYAGYAPKTHPDFDTDRVTFLNASDNFVFSRGSGLVTFDAAALDNINAVNRIDTFEVDELVFKGDYIFAIGSLNPNIGFSIIDFSDPSNATILRSFELESTGINFSFPGNPCPSSPLSQKYSYTDNLVLIPATDAVSIIDITDPINANEVKRVDMENTLNAIFIYGDHAYVTTATGLSIIDISNPVSAEVINAIALGGDSYSPDVVHNLYIDSGYAYIISEKGLVVIDVTNPLEPNVLVDPAIN